MITNYTVNVRKDGKWGPLDRVDLRSGYTIFTEGPDTSGRPHVGNTINLPAFNKKTYLLKISPEEANYKQAAMLHLPIFDNGIGQNSLSPQQSVRGWAAFQFNGKADGDLRITLTDQVGKTHTYLSATEKGNRL